MKRADMKMIETAAKHRWAIPESHRIEAVEALMQILVGLESSDREKIAATRALVAMDVLNQKDEHENQLQSDRNRFLEIAERLGIRKIVEPTAEDGAGDVVEGTVVRPKGKRQRPRAKKKAKKRRSGSND